MAKAVVELTIEYPDEWDSRTIPDWEWQHMLHQDPDNEGEIELLGVRDRTMFVGAGK